jgi:SPP1 gp7 family putative phage head morphogenesis protein
MCWALPMSPISINFNLPFNEAIQQMASRGVVLPDLYHGQLQGIHRQLAFSIANVAKLDQLQGALDSLTNHLKNGGTFAQWQKNVDVKALGLPKHRLDNIFRTNIQQAYNHGHWQQALTNKSTHGYLLYDAINDSRTRPSHKANDGVIRKIDDPIWKRIWFSRNVYRCRCRLISLTEKQAIARSGDGQGIYKLATEDPKRDTAWDTVDVMNTDMMGFGIDRAIAERMANVKIDSKLLSELDKKRLTPLDLPKFTPAKTAKKAAKYMIDNNIVDTADFGKIKDIGIINEWNEALFNAVREFPELRANQKFTGSSQAQIKRWRDLEIERVKSKFIAKGYAEDRAIASAERIVPEKIAPSSLGQSSNDISVKGVALNEEFATTKKGIKELRSIQARGVEAGYYPAGCDTIKYIVDHELGHQLDDLLLLNMDTEIIAVYKELKN